MAFVVGSLIIGTGAALGSAAISSKGAKDAAKIAAAGSDKEIAYNRESRDIALDLGSPYREAGYAALDKAGEMTGLIDSGGTFGRPNTNAVKWQNSPWQLSQNNGQYTATMGNQKLTWDDSTNQWMDSRASAYGDNRRIMRGVAGRAGGGVMYNVNELGPENVYSGGAITRSSNPKTMPPDPRGYVHPNIQGRAIGGSMVDPNSMGDNTGYYRGSSVGQIVGNIGSGSIVDPNAIGARGGEFGYRDGIPGQTQPGAVNDMPQGYQGTTWLDAQGNEVQGPDGSPGSGRAWLNQYHQNLPTGGSSGGVTVDENGNPVPQENPYDFTTDPGYQFRLNEGMRALESSAAARGGLLSGGFGRKAIRYGQDYASNEFSNIYNRISNIAGLGQVSAGQGGVFAQNAGAQMGGAAQNGALSSAYGQMAGTNAWSNAFNEIAQLPWDKVV